MRKTYTYSRKKRTIKRSIFVFLAAFSSMIMLFYYIYFSFSPAIFEAAKKRSKAHTSLLISKTIFDILDTEEELYSDIVKFQKNNDGEITALTTNMVYINKLKSQISSNIYDSISNINEEELSFNLGSVTGNLLLNGIGPKIKVMVNTISSVNTDFHHEFITGGINQTNHRIYLEISTTYSLLVPFSVITDTVSTSFCIAENVIVGKTPEAFTNVQNYGGNENANVADEVVDFGAHVNFD